MRLVVWNLFLFVLIVLLPNATVASVKPMASTNDAHFQTIKYHPEQVVQLMVSQGYELTIAFASGEQIDNIAIGDASSWQVTPNKRGDYLFIKLIGNGLNSTNLTVITSMRTYIFMLTPAYGGENELPFLVKFEYPNQDSDKSQNSDNAKRVAPAKKYKLSGNNMLKPIIIYDDGLQTFIEFSPKQDMPAIYSLDESGNTSLIDGKIRDGKYVIDSINRRLLFRLGNKTATAIRVVARGEDGS